MKGLHGSERVFFIFPKNGQYIAKTTREKDLESSFRDWGPISLRSHAKNCFYPIVIKDMKILSFGDVCKDNFHPKSSNTNNKKNKETIKMEIIFKIKELLGQPEGPHGGCSVRPKNHRGAA